VWCVCVCVCVCGLIGRKKTVLKLHRCLVTLRICVCVCVSGRVWVTDVVGVSLHACVSKRTIMHISGFTWEKYLSLAVAGRANMDILAFHILPVPEKHQVTVMHGCLA